MSFDEGLAIGLMLGRKIGSKKSDETDADYEKWENLIEPVENQAVFLVRVPNTAAKHVIMTIGYAIDMYYEDSWTVDWGDGTSSTGYSRQGSVSHDYSAIGEYTVIFTSHMVSCNNSAAVTSSPTISNKNNAALIMAKYGDLIHAESNLNSALFSKYFFSSCGSLRTIFFGGNIETIYDNMFTSCQTLDISNLKFSALSIGKNAFNFCMNIKEIAMPQCNMIGDRAFALCYGLRKAIFPKCYNVSTWAFQSCRALVQTSFADDCVFDTEAFDGCTSLYPYPSDNT